MPSIPVPGDGVDMTQDEVAMGPAVYSEGGPCTSNGRVAACVHAVHDDVLVSESIPEGGNGSSCVQQVELSRSVVSDSLDSGATMTATHPPPVMDMPVEPLIVPKGFIICILCKQCLSRSRYSLNQQSKSKGKVPPRAKCKDCIALGM